MRILTIRRKNRDAWEPEWESQRAIEPERIRERASQSQTELQRKPVRARGDQSEL